jgi:hypothetical protein
MNKSHLFHHCIAILLICMAFNLAGCAQQLNGAGDSGKTPGIVEQAAGTATALVQNANATAMVMEAQAMATALVAKAQGGNPTSTLIPPTIPTSEEEKDTSSTPALAQKSSPQETAAPPLTTPIAVQVMDVTTAADGGLIMVQYRAPARLAETWRQGNVFVIDEANGNRYGEIPVAGPIGPLISHPKEDGKQAYFMVVNAPVPLIKGTLVSVVMGEFKQEHIVIQ